MSFKACHFSSPWDDDGTYVKAVVRRFVCDVRSHYDRGFGVSRGLAGFTKSEIGKKKN